MASVALIAWPYDAGLGDVGMGSGASMLLADEELHQGLSAGTDRVTVETVPPVDPALPEITRIFELDRRLARHVARARARGAFPLVLAGNCISALGTTAGVRDGERLGVVWLDAHADLDTPEDNLSGFTDVMGLSILTGGAWRALRATIPGFAPVGERDVVMAGVRDLEPYQRERLAGTEIAVVPGRVELGELRARLDELAGRVRRVYLHVDLDVLDTSVGRANRYAAAGGPDLDTVLAVIGETFARFTVAAAALTAYDPQADEGRTILAAARTIAARIAEGAG